MPGGKNQPAGQTTTTTNTAPWAAQQPYLTEAFKSAQDLFKNFTPQYYPGATYAPPTTGQTEGLNNIQSTAENLSPSIQSGNNFSNALLGGQFLNNDPSLGFFGQLASTNLGASGGNAGFNTLDRMANGPNLGFANPATSTLESYASGAHAAAGNPYTTGLTNSVLSQVVPNIQKQFINGGNLSNPQAAYASSQGATAALAPLMFNQYQQEEQNQLGAANTLGSNYLTGAGLQQNAASTLGTQALTGGALQNSAANNLSTGYNNDISRMIQGLALQPQTLANQFLPGQEEYAAGAQGQQLSQQAINDAIQRFNYSQTLPYQQLNQFLSNIGGSYGGSGTTSSPYFQNDVANALGGGLGGAALGSALLGPSGLGLLGAGGASAAGGGLGLLLALM